MASARVFPKVICFTCRQSSCACVARLNREAEIRSHAGSGEVAWVFAWLGGACALGTALGAVLALLFN